MKLTKQNTEIFRSERGNFYITHPEHKTKLRFYASEDEIKADSEWRTKISIREGSDNSFYAVLSKAPLEKLDY